MRRVAMIVAVGMIACGVAWAAGVPQISVATAPPVVVKTMPQAGDAAVDPSITEIQVTFSKPMADKSWSWVGGGETYPESTGMPHYLADGKTCVLPVRLQAGKTYLIGMNSQRARNFKDRQGQPAMPYLVVFETRK